MNGYFHWCLCMLIWQKLFKCFHGELCYERLFPLVSACLIFSWEDDSWTPLEIDGNRKDIIRNCYD